VTVPLDIVQEGFAALGFDDEVTAAAARSLTDWLEQPAFEEYRPQLQALLDAGKYTELFDAFWQTIPFGTGGRRGPVGLGPNRFNFHTLLTSVQGHAETLRETAPDGALRVVLAYDVRVYRDLRGVYDPELPNPLLGSTSADFARRAAEVYVGNGLDVLMLDPAGPAYMTTPELSFAIRHHRAHGGLNVSASHNHPDDNGGKFYNRHGGQDIPPHDEQLALRVEGITSVRATPFDEAVQAGSVRFLGESDNERYLAMNRKLSLAPGVRGGRIVYTPLNGTGSATVGRLLRGEGFDVVSVPEQEPFDGGFASVRFLAPNPELPSCFDLAERVGDACNADMLLATDPDADRIGVELRRPDGSWRFVSGDETLLLVLHFLLERRAAQGTLPDDAFVLTTLVSTSRLTSIARAFGCTIVDDLLVGLKWQADALAQLELTGSWRELRCRPESFIMGGEESHGFMLTQLVRDKDAAPAALLLAEYNACVVAEGRCLSDELDRLYATHGYMANRLFTTVMTGAAGLARMRAIQTSLRATPPESVAGVAVTSCIDLADEACWLGPLRSGTDAAARNVLSMTLEGGVRITVRPSGTEPKTKLYVEVPGTTPAVPMEAAQLDRERSRCDALAERLGRDFERLMLDRVGIHLAGPATQLSGMLGIEHKQHFGETFLPALEAALRTAPDDLVACVDEGLAAYGREPRALVAAGMASWLAATELPDAARATIEDLFGL
jgi:phosphoglucomutase/phosphomannomutase